MSTRHLSVLLGALLLAGVALTIVLLVQGPRQVEDQSVRLFEAQQEILAEQGAARVAQTLSDLQVRLATASTQLARLPARGRTQAEWQALLSYIGHSSDKEMGITLAIEDAQGHLLAMDPRAPAAYAQRYHARNAEGRATPPKEGIALCRDCIDEHGAVVVRAPMESGGFLVADVEIDQLAGEVFRQLTSGETSHVSLEDKSEHVLYESGTTHPSKDTDQWVRGEAPVPGTDWHVEAAAARADIAPEVRQQARSMLYSSAAILGVLVLGAGVLAAMKLREERERLERVRSLAHYDKLATMGMMAGSTAHEIRNAIAAAKLQLQVAMARAGEPDLNRHLKAANRSVDRLGKLAENLSNYAGRDKQQLACFDLAEAIDEALSIVEPKIRNEVTVDFAADPELFVFGSRSNLVQVVVNLVLNAYEAAADVEYGRVEIRARRNDGRVVVSVTDNGLGIAPDLLERIFEPFFSTKDGTGVGGTGIGLWLCSQIIAQHNGEISAENTPDGGARFVVDLPTAAEARADAGAKADESADELTARPSV